MALKALGEGWTELGYSLTLQPFGYNIDPRQAHVAHNEAGDEVYHVYIHRDVFKIRGKKERKKCDESLAYLGSILPQGKPIIVLSEGHQYWPTTFENVHRHWEVDLGRSVWFLPWDYIIALRTRRQRIDVIQRILIEVRKYTPYGHSGSSAGPGGTAMTPTPSNRVFICYSHQDDHWLDRLLEHLSPLVRAQVVDPFSDRDIKYGRWFDRIVAAIESARVAVLLVSRPFLASDFINNEEIPRLLQQEASRNMTVLPVIISPCRFQHEDSLSQFQAVNPPSKPLTSMSENDQEELFVKLTETIEKALLAP